MRHRFEDGSTFSLVDALLLLGAVLLSIPLIVGASCRPPNPPVDPCQGVTCPPGQECKGGTCVPTLPPPPTEPPQKGVPYRPELLLRSSQGRLTLLDGTPFEFVQAQPCCMSWIEGLGVRLKQPPRPAPWRIGAVERNTGWPLAHPDWMDYTTNRGGVNAYHFRGPWKAGIEGEEDWGEIGGQYLPGPALDWNPRYWELERNWIYRAGKVGRVAEKTIIDTWGCKPGVGEWYSPWPLSDAQACGITWTAEHERYTRKVVEELGCMGNVIWITGNEETNIPGWQKSWFRKMRDVVRDEEQKSGCGFVHLFGTGIPELFGEFDYAVTHDRSPLTAPLYPSKWSLQNEHNPEYPPEIEVQNFSRARSFGGSWSLWRGEASDADYGRVLDGVKEVLEGGGPPPPTACTLGTPTARQALADGKAPTILVQRTTGGISGAPTDASKWISGTPLANFGRDYYCSIGWEAACAEGRIRGPVAPDGHPQRLACEQQFLEAPCPTFSQKVCTGTDSQCPITWDPYIVLDGKNQNHPDNVRAGCRESSFVLADGRIIMGEWWKATAHGKGTLKACNFDGSVCGTSNFEIDQ